MPVRSATSWVNAARRSGPPSGSSDMLYLTAKRAGLTSPHTRSTWLRMSRAFVKEQDADPGDEPLPPDSPHPLYVTPEGLAELQSRRGALAAALEGRAAASEPAAAEHYRREKRELRLIERKLARAIPVDPAQHPPGGWLSAIGS